MIRLALPAILAILLLPAFADAQDPLQVIDPRSEAFTAQPYPSKFIDVDGVPIHYVEAGVGAPVLFIHGNPTSSYLWRNVMPHVALEGRVIALDLPGFGHSGKSPTGYTLQDQQRYLDGFIAALGLANLTLVMHEWGAVLGLDYARRNEHNVKGVVLIEPILPPRFPVASYDDLGPAGSLYRRLRDPVEGRKLVIGDNMLVEDILAHGALTRELTEAEIAAYRLPFVDRARPRADPRLAVRAADRRRAGAQRRGHRAHRRLAAAIGPAQAVAVRPPWFPGAALGGRVDGRELSQSRGDLRGLRQPLHPRGQSRGDRAQHRRLVPAQPRLGAAEPVPHQGKEDYPGGSIQPSLGNSGCLMPMRSTSIPRSP